MAKVGWTYMLFAGLLFLGSCQNDQAKTDHGIAGTDLQYPVRLITETGHAGEVFGAAVSPDGRFIVTGSLDHTARIWEVATQQTVQVLRGHTDWVYAVALSPDGHYIATGSLDRTTRIWDVISGQTILTLQGHNGRVQAIAFSPDGRFVITGSNDATARVWDLQSGNVLQVLRTNNSGMMNTVAFLPDGQHLVTGSEDGAIRIWETRTGKVIQTLTAHSGGVNNLAVSPDGRYLITGGIRDAIARVWNVKSGKVVRELQGHTSGIEAVAFSSDGQSIVTGGYRDYTIRIWELRGGETRQVLQGHNRGVHAVAFMPAGNEVVTAGDNDVTSIWDINSGKETHTFRGFPGWALAVGISPDGRYLITGNADGKTYIWDVTSGREVRVLAQHAGWVCALAVSPDGRYIVTGSRDNTARVWEANNGKLLQVFKGHTDGVCTVAISPDGQSVATGSFDDSVRIWKLATGENEQTLQQQGRGVHALAYTPDGQFLLTGDTDGKVRIWNVASGQVSQDLLGHKGRVNDVAITRDGQFAFSVSNDGIRMWDIPNGQLVQILPERSGDIFSVVISPDGRYVITTNNDHEAHIWNVSRGSIERVLEGHTARVFSAAISPDGRYVMTGAQDGTIRFWHTASGKEICQMVLFWGGGWAIVDRDGRYDATNGGEVSGLHWAVHNEAVALSQLKDRYYVPGLLAKLLTTDQGQPRPVETLQNVTLYPEVEYAAPQGNSTIMTLNVHNRGGGIGPIQVKLNGSEFITDARVYANVSADAATATVQIDLGSAPTLKPGEANTIEVITRNADGYLQSRRDSQRWQVPQKLGVTSRQLPAIANNEVSNLCSTVAGVPITPIVPTSGPELYAITVGIAKYKDPTMRLNWSDQDAVDMATAFELGGKRLFGVEKVHRFLLSTAAHPASLPPTKENLLRVLCTVQQSARAGDIVLLFLSGHGISRGEKGTPEYYFFTQEAWTPKVDDPAIRQTAAFSSQELATWIRSVRAEKRVVIIDTCRAGAAADSLLAPRQPVPEDQTLALERLKDRFGFHVLVGSEANADSYEASRYGHGLLTHALLEGMGGSALRDGQYINVVPLFLYVSERVPQLAQISRGIQLPQFMQPERGQSFDIGMLTDVEKRNLPLRQTVPLLIPASLTNSEEAYDNLGLTALVTGRLQNDVQEERDRARSWVMYPDAPSGWGAIKPSGTYTVNGQDVTVNLVLLHDNKPIERFTVTGQATDVPALVDSIVQHIVLTLQTLARTGLVSNSNSQ